MLSCQLLRNSPAALGSLISGALGEVSGMTKISGATFFYKKLFPTFVFGFFIFCITLTIVHDGITSDNSVGLAAIVAMMVYVFFFFKKLAWDMVDEVFDCGDSLIYRSNGNETRVMLSDIIRIDCAHCHSPERVKIIAHSTTGTEVEFAFCLIGRIMLNSRDKNPVVLELMERVEQAKIT